MPLIKSGSRKAIGENIEREQDAGKPHRQAVAIALAVARKAKRRRRGGKVKRRADGGASLYGDIGAAMPEAYGANSPIMDPIANSIISTATLPKRAIDAAAADVQERGDTGPDRQLQATGPALEAALAIMGGGVGGVPGEGTALGSGPARMRMVDQVDLTKELANQRRAKGWATGKSAQGWDFKRPDAAKGSFQQAVAEARAKFAGDAHSARLDYDQVAPGNPNMTADDWAFVDNNIRKGNPALGSGATDSRGAAATAGLNAGLGGGPPIRAYHGSPHDFDAFDLSKIGTGEGAQVYGHGLYFAENPKVAHAYAENLGTPTINGVPYNEANPEHYATDFWHNTAQGMGMSREETTKMFADDLADMKASKHPADAKRLPFQQQVHDIFASGKDIPNFDDKIGHRYEVGINADPEHFLDWDKPLSQQHDRVKNALPDLLRENTLHDAELNHFMNTKTGEDAVRRIARPSYPIRDDKGAPWKASGAKTYDEALAMVGGDKSRVNRVLTPDPAYTAEALRNARIPGIRYLDQGSRITGDAAKIVDKYGSREKALEVAQKRLKSAGTGDLKYWDGITKQLATPESRNYVVLNDKVIDILRKYGLAGLPAAGVAAGAAQQGGQEHADGGAVKHELRKAIARARGGKVHVGPIKGDEGGRTDVHEMAVPDGAYVLPSETISHMGENNTDAGLKRAQELFGPDGEHAPKGRARGGAASSGKPVDCITAGGEFVIAPSVVAHIGGGDVERGHKILDHFVMTMRKDHIKTLATLPAPAKD